MSERETEFMTQFKRWSIGIFLGGIITITAFYYNTQNDIKDHCKRIERLENNSYSKESIDLKLNLILNELEHLRNDIKEIKEKK